MITTLSGVGISIFALAAVNFSESRLRREVKEATDVAHQLSQGELYEDDASGEPIGEQREDEHYKPHRGSSRSDKANAGVGTHRVVPWERKAPVFIAKA